MTGQDTKDEDQAYDSLIEELGLNLDLNDADGAGDDAVFAIRDTDAPSHLRAETESPDGGVEIPPELMAELKAVVGLDDPGTAAAESAIPTEAVDDATSMDVSDNAPAGFVGEAEDEIPYVDDPLTLGGIEDNPLSEEDETEDFDLGFDAGDVLREALAEREQELAAFDADEDASADVAPAEDDVATSGYVSPEQFDAAFEVEDDETEVEEFNYEPSFETETDSYTSLDDLPEPSDSESLIADLSLSLGALNDEADAQVDVQGEDLVETTDAVEDRDLAEILKSTALDGFAEESEQTAELQAPTLNLDDLEDETVGELPPPPMDVVEDDDDVDYSYVYGGDAGGDRLVPRITIHAFCQTSPVTRLLSTAQSDRRMANVAMDVQPGGVRAAIDYYADKQTPHLMIVESTARPAQLLAELDELAQYCDENVKVIVVGAANDIRLYRELMRRGVSEYLVPPLEPVQVIRAISALFVDTEAPFVGKSIAVTGVKGGVGASTVAHNLAWALSQNLECSTTLVDLDLNFGTAGLDFNQESQQTIADAIGSPERFDEAVLERLLNRVTDRLSLFTAPGTLDRTYDLDPAVYEQVMGLVRASVPFAVLDLPHIWADWFKSAVVGADDIVVVAQPDLASLRNGKNMIDFLKAARPNDAAPRLVINNVGVPKRPEIPVKDFAQAIGVEPELVLPFDPQLFGTAANNGQMIADVAPDSKCSQGMDYLASVLSGRAAPSQNVSLLSKLFRK